MTAFEIRTDLMIPVADGHAVNAGWLDLTGGKPAGITWHWTATPDLATCDSMLGGPNPVRKGEASAHYAIGRSFAEGVSCYVSLENRSWHAGVNQVLRWDGKSARTNRQWWGAARTCIGIEVVNIGYERPGVPAGSDWIPCASPDGHLIMKVQPWPEEQMAMMIAIGKQAIARWPHIKPRDHHGHHDICPGYKVDVCGFPFARVLRGIYDDPSIPDVWSKLWTVKERQACLVKLGYSLGRSGPERNGVDGDWGRLSDAALRRFQREHKMVEDGMWTTFVNWKVHEVLARRGLSL